MSLNPYEPPQIASAASDKDRASSNKLAGDQPRFSRTVTLAMGLLFAPCLAILTTALAFSLLALLGGVAANFPAGPIGLLTVVVTFSLPLFAGFYTLRQVAVWLSAPEWWEIASVALWLALGVTLLIGYVFYPR